MSPQKNARDAAHISIMRLVLVGNYKAGKSSSGNTILGGEQFATSGRTAECVKREGEIEGRQITLVEAPGWFITSTVAQTPERDKQEIVLSVSMCPPGPHAVLLNINVNDSFTLTFRRAVQQHLELLGRQVWSHTILLFTNGDCLGNTSIEQHIESGGEALQWLVEKCGNRYHVLDNERRDGGQVTELLEKIEEMVAGNRGHHLTSNATMLKQLIEKRSKEQRRATERRMKVEERTKSIRSAADGVAYISEMRLVLLGYRYAGKSSSGNTILGREEFGTSGRTTECVKREGEIEGGSVTLVEAPGWWKNFTVNKTSVRDKVEIVRSVSLCPPGPHALLLNILILEAFTEMHRKVIQQHLELLGENIWNNVIILFTCGDYLGDTSIEQHIETEGEALQWLVEKCGNRYHVIDNLKSERGQVTELLEKIEELVTGNSECLFKVEHNVKSRGDDSQDETEEIKSRSVSDLKRVFEDAPKTPSDLNSGGLEEDLGTPEEVTSVETSRTAEGDEEKELNPIDITSQGVSQEKSGSTEMNVLTGKPDSYARGEKQLTPEQEDASSQNMSLQSSGFGSGGEQEKSGLTNIDIKTETTTSQAGGKKVEFQQPPDNDSISSQGSQEKSGSADMETVIQKTNQGETTQNASLKDPNDLVYVDRSIISVQYDKCIGSGAFGRVYRGSYQGTPAAVKVISTGDTSMITNEFLIPLRLSHPNIVSMMAVAKTDTEIFISNEYIHGANLHQILHRQTNIKLDQEEKLCVALDVAMAVQYIHSKEIIHQDLKPANIMIAADNRRAYLMDWGLANCKETVLTTLGCHQTRAKNGPQGGTPTYMAPECLLDYEDCSQQSDMYSLGITLLEMFTQSAPWIYSKVQELRRFLSKGQAPHAMEKLQPPADAIVQPLLNFDPKTRMCAKDLVALLKTKVDMDKRYGFTW